MTARSSPGQQLASILMPGAGSWSASGRWYADSHILIKPLNLGSMGWRPTSTEARDEHSQQNEKRWRNRFQESRVQSAYKSIEHAGTMKAATQPRVFPRTQDAPLNQCAAQQKQRQHLYGRCPPHPHNHAHSLPFVCGKLEPKSKLNRRSEKMKKGKCSQAGVRDCNNNSLVIKHSQGPSVPPQGL